MIGRLLREYWVAPRGAVIDRLGATPAALRAVGLDTAVSRPIGHFKFEHAIYVACSMNVHYTFLATSDILEFTIDL